MRLQRAVKKSPARHSEDIVVFEVNGARFAIPAAAVDEIRNKQSLQPYPATSRTARVRYTVLREDKARVGKNRAASTAAPSPTHAGRNDEGQAYYVVAVCKHLRIPALHTS